MKHFKDEKTQGRPGRLRLLRRQTVGGEGAYSEDGEAKKIALLVHFLHYLIVFGGAKETGLLNKNDFQKITFRVEPHLYGFGGHKSHFLAEPVYLARYLLRLCHTLKISSKISSLGPS